MAWLMTSATVVRRASSWVCRGHLDDMFIDMVAFDMLQMTILKVVNMTTVTYGGVPAIRAVHMRCRHDLPRCLASLRWTLESSPIGGNQVYSLVLKILSAKSAQVRAAQALAPKPLEPAPIVMICPDWRSPVKTRSTYPASGAFSHIMVLKIVMSRPSASCELPCLEARRDLNQRPLAYKASALTAELRARCRSSRLSVPVSRRSWRSVRSEKSPFGNPTTSQGRMPSWH
jgi:hypothetical protein